MSQELWIVGKNTAATPDGVVWECQGVFSTEAAALAECTTYEHFIGPLNLDVAQPAETTPWRGLYFPLSENPDRTPNAAYLSAMSDAETTP